MNPSNVTTKERRRSVKSRYVKQEHKATRKGAGEWGKALLKDTTYRPSDVVRLHVRTDTVMITTQDKQSTQNTTDCQASNRHFKGRQRRPQRLTVVREKAIMNTHKHTYWIKNTNTHMNRIATKLKDQRVRRRTNK